MRVLLFGIGVFSVLAGGPTLAQSCNASGNPPANAQGNVTPSCTPYSAVRVSPQDGSGHDVSSTYPLPVQATFSGTVNTGATAGANAPSLSPGTNNLYEDLSGNLRVLSSPVPVTPSAGTASAVVTGGTAVTLVTGPVKGCYVVNPLTAGDQNISSAEVAYVNPVTTATANGRGTNSALQPGQGFYCPPQTTNVSAIAATSGHAFNVVVW